LIYDVNLASTRITLQKYTKSKKYSCKLSTVVQC